MDGRAVRLLLRAGPEELRLRRQRDLDHAGRAKRRSTSRLPYYTANQAVVALKGSEAAKAKSLADLKDTKIGVQINTTSLAAVDEEIEPSSKPEVFNSSGDVVTALKNGQVEAVVVDLPTALYLTAAQVENATIVGQFGKRRRRRMGRPAGERIAAHRLRLAGRSKRSKNRANWKRSRSGG